MRTHRSLAHEATRWPNLFLAGVPKSGTRTLEHALASHPDIYMCPVAAPLFFADLGIGPRWERFFDVVSDEERYLSLFASSNGERYLCEASANYLFFPDALRRIREVSPAAKLIVSLRDPIDRAFSHYLNDVREGLELRTFLEAVRDQIADPDGQPWPSRYVAYGHYAPGLSLALDLYGRDLHVILFEDLVRSPGATLAGLARFLDLELTTFGVIQHRNPAGVPRNPTFARLLGSPTFREVARALLPHPARPAARRLLIRSGIHPRMERRAAELLREEYRHDLDAVAELLGRRPAWRNFAEVSV